MKKSNRNQNSEHSKKPTSGKQSKSAKLKLRKGNQHRPLSFLRTALYEKDGLTRL